MQTRIKYKSYVIFSSNYEREIALCLDCAREFERVPKDHLLKNEEMKKILWNHEDLARYDALCEHIKENKY